MPMLTEGSVSEVGFKPLKDCALHSDPMLKNAQSPESAANKRLFDTFWRAVECSENLTGFLKRWHFGVGMAKVERIAFSRTLDKGNFERGRK